MLHISKNQGTADYNYVLLRCTGKDEYTLPAGQATPVSDSGNLLKVVEQFPRSKLELAAYLNSPSVKFIYLGDNVTSKYTAVIENESTSNLSMFRGRIRILSMPVKPASGKKARPSNSASAEDPTSDTDSAYEKYKRKRLYRDSGGRKPGGTPILRLEQGTSIPETKSQKRRVVEEPESSLTPSENTCTTLALRRLCFLELPITAYKNLGRFLLSAYLSDNDGARERILEACKNQGPTALLCVVSNFDAAVLGKGADDYQFLNSEHQFLKYVDKQTRQFACSAACDDKLVLDGRRNSGVTFDGDYPAETVRLHNVIRYCIAELLHHHPELKILRPYCAWVDQKPAAQWLTSNNLQLTGK